MSKYPDVAKLKEKYSPQKRIPTAMVDGRPVFAGINSTNTKLETDGQKARNLGGFSPIRRSGSPVRRQNILDIEQVSRKRRNDDDGETETEERPKKKTVSFNSNVQYDQNTPMSQDIASVDASPNLVSKLLNLVNALDQRLDVIEDTQQQIVAHLQSKDDDKIPEKMESLNESIKELILSIRPKEKI